MSFGKRGRPQASAPASSHGSASGGGAGEPPRGGGDDAEPDHVPSILWQQLRGIGIGVAIAIGIYVAYYVGMRSAGRALDDAWSAGAEIDWTAIVPLPSKPISASQQELRGACLKLQSRPPVPMSEADAFERQLGNSSRDRVATVGSYLACSAEHLRERFCRPEERARLVEHLRLYLQFREVVLSGRIIESWLGPEPSHQIVTGPGTEGSHQHLLRALRELAERGLLSSSDFGVLGFGVPAELAPAIKGTTVKERVCR